MWLLRKPFDLAKKRRRGWAGNESVLIVEFNNQTELIRGHFLLKPT